MTIDTNLSPTSTNAVQNKAIYSALEDIYGAMVELNAGNGLRLKFGASIDQLVGGVNDAGVYYSPSNLGDLVFTGVTDINTGALSYTFKARNINSASFPDLTSLSYSSGLASTFGSSYLTSVSFPNLATVSGDRALENTFSYSHLTSLTFPALTTVTGASALGSICRKCDYLLSVSFPSLTTVSGNYAFYLAFHDCYALESVSFPSLTTISGSSAFENAFGRDSNPGDMHLQTISFPSLSSVTGQSVFEDAFTLAAEGCDVDVYFPALHSGSFGSYTNQFHNLVYRAPTNTLTVHFPSNLEAVIGSWSDIVTLQSRITILYDLSATS